MKKKARWLVVVALLIGVGSADAFIYARDNSLLWTGAVDSNWNVDGNWDNVQGPDYGVPGDSTNEYSYALIESGIVNITPASAPAFGVGRAYVGGTNAVDAVLNIGADVLFERFLVSWLAGETGTVNLTAGTMSVTYDGTQFRIGKAGTGIFNISGGTLNGTRIMLSSDPDSVCEMEISSGAINASDYIWMNGGTATLKVSGSGSTIVADRFAAEFGKSHALELGLDAGGVTLINVIGDIAGNGDTYEGVILNDLAIVVDDLPGFNGSVGDSYDIFSSATYITTTNGLTVTSNIDGVDFSWAIVTEGGNEILRLTIVPPLKFDMAGTMFVPTGFQLQWNGVAGRSYRLDVSTDLTDTPAFTVLQSGIPGTEGLTEFIDTAASGRAQSFYRVVEE